jgi:hypothetical protein
MNDICIISRKSASRIVLRIALRHMYLSDISCKSKRHALVPSEFGCSLKLLDVCFKGVMLKQFWLVYFKNMLTVISKNDERSCRYL